jgi:hypothetical protein
LMAEATNDGDEVIGCVYLYKVPVTLWRCDDGVTWLPVGDVAVLKVGQSGKELLTRLNAEKNAYGTLCGSNRDIPVPSQLKLDIPNNSLEYNDAYEAFIQLLCLATPTGEVSPSVMAWRRSGANAAPRNGHWQCLGMSSCLLVTGVAQESKEPEDFVGAIPIFAGEDLIGWEVRRQV